MRDGFGAVQGAHRLDQSIGAATPDPDADQAGLVVDVRLALANRLDGSGRVLDPRSIRHHELNNIAADPALQILRSALGDYLAVVEDRDRVSELISLIEVLGGKQ